MSLWGRLGDMVGRLGEGTAGQTVIDWACPVPYFGIAAAAAVATVGLNPSDREFCSPAGQPLRGDAARFPTLESLGLPTWGAASHVEIAAVADACDRYFGGRPYERWFGVLDDVIQSAGVSYYSRAAPACHLDLTPYATAAKWATLLPAERRYMIEIGAPWFLDLLAETPIEMLILNGASVVGAVEASLGIELKGRRASDLDLPRRDGGAVDGWWYDTEISAAGGHPLGRTLRLVGWNHNLQSSFGVTRAVRDAIARRVSIATNGARS